MELIVLIAAFLICPVGVAALFAFALFADRHFKGSLPVSRGHVPPAQTVRSQRDTTSGVLRR
jgi:hypothetical protein